MYTHANPMHFTRSLRTARLALPALLLLVSAVAGAQTFANIPPLSFAAVAGGANPLPQVLAMASTGTQIIFSVTPSTTTGGNWLCG